MSPLARIVFLATIGLALPATAQTVGVAAATSGQPRGTPPAQNERVLQVGVDVFANERVRTGPADRAHLVFRDGSALSVGVNSELVIDRFVYDPGTRAGDLALNATRGAFRFVGGAISKKSEVRINTPASIIGVRGGIATVVIGADNSSTITFLFGDSVVVSNAAGSQKMIRHGSQIFVPYGGPPSPPVVLPPGSLQAYLGLFEQAQAGAAVPGPGDRAQLEAVVASLNSQPLPRPDTAAGLQPWLAYLQVLSMQAITTTNANRISGGQPPSSQPQSPPTTPPGTGP